MIFLFMAFAVVLVALILLLVFRRRKQSNRLRLSEIGTIIDRALRAYRRNLVPLLALSAICAPLGAVAYASIFSFFFDNAPRLPSPGSGGGWLQTVRQIITIVVLVMGSLGLGRTLLACGVAQAMHDEANGQAVSLRRMLSQQRWRATVGLMGRLILPSLIRAVFGVLGTLVTLSWWVAPTALIYEGLDARAAVKHGRELVRPVRGQLADTLAPLWVIGWLIAGVPLFGAFWLLSLLVTLPAGMLDGATLVAWITGAVFVAPLMALGNTQFYLYVRDRAFPIAELTRSPVPAGEQVSI
jgi:hypothetical protein